MMGCAVFSLAYLLTGSILAAIGGHIVLHVVAVLRGTELPPRREAVRPKHPTQDRPAPRRLPSDLTTVRR
jgi:hypothetical protein